MEIEVRQEFTLTVSARELAVIACSLQLVRRADGTDRVEVFGNRGIPSGAVVAEALLAQIDKDVSLGFGAFKDD